MNNRAFPQITLILIFGCFVIIGIFFLFRTQSVRAQKNVINEQGVIATPSGVDLAVLKLTKKSHPHTFYQVGQLINYNYVIKNTGTDPITATLSVADDKLPVTCQQPAGGRLLPNQRITCKGTYAITQADLDAGHVTNHATASGGGFTSNLATVTISANQTRSLRLTKLSVSSTYDHIGQSIEDNYVILNTGNVSLSGPFAVADNKVPVTCTQPVDGSLSPGETMNCVSSYTVTQADLDVGSLTNLATASGGGVSSNQATATLTAIQTRSLLLSKAANPLTFVHVGEAITYSYIIKNTGNVTLTGLFAITDDKAMVTCTQPGDGALSPGEMMSCTATYSITQADLDVGIVTNLATASGGGLTSNVDSATVTAALAHALLLTKLGEPQTYNQLGQPINYDYVIRNTSNVTLTGPFSIVDDKATVTCTQSGDGALSPQEAMDCRATYTITQPDLDTGSVTNMATASGGGASSNQATETVTGIQTRSLQLNKVAEPLTYDHVGQTIDYSYVISNTGNVTLAGAFSVTDDQVTVTCTQPIDGSLSPGEAMQCASSYTITQADLDAGSVINQAMAAGGGATSNHIVVTVSAVHTKSLLLTKIADPLTYSQVGDTITYNYMLINAGNVTLAGPFSVTDDTVTVTCTQPTDGALSPGETMSCTAAYIITQAELDAGSITNLAIASGTDVASNEDSATVISTHAYSLLLTKAGNPLTYDQVGQEIVYSYAIMNIGSATLSGPFTVTDNKTTPTCTQPVDGDLSPGESMSCTASYLTTEADLDAGSIINQATATGGGATSNLATEAVTTIQTRALLLTKTAAPLTYDHVGQTIDYHYVITNAGNVTLVDTFSVSDNKVAVTCTQPVDGALSPGEGMDCVSSYIITLADLDIGSVLNLATASGGGVQSNQVARSVMASQNRSLLLDKTAAPLIYDHAGQIISYSYTFTNTGNVSLVDIFSVVDNKATVTCTQPADGALSPQESMDCAATYAITQGDLESGSVANLATASGGGATSNQADAAVSTVETRSLQLTKLAAAQTYDHVGQTIGYSYSITNTGNVNLAGPFSVADDKATVDCTQPVDGELSPLESMACTTTYTITQADLDEGNVINLATATGGGAGSNQASESISAVQTRSLLLAKAADPLTYDQVGQTIDYSYLITNTGNVTLPGPFSVSDNKATVTCTQPVDGALSPDEAMVCASTYSITQADLDAGSVTNLATASGGGANSNQVTATVAAVQTRSLTLTKIADPLAYDHPGQVISYTYNVENTGNVYVSAPFIVYDDKVTDETCPPSPVTLAPGQSISCAASYMILMSDMFSGSVTNSAYAIGSVVGEPVTSNTDIVTIRTTRKYFFLPVVIKAMPYGTHVLPDSYAYVSHNIMFIVGEVMNNTVDTLSWVSIPVSFYNSNGNQVGNGSAYMWPLELPAGEKGCFKISMDVPQNWSYYQFGTPTYFTSSASPGLVINNPSGAYDPATGDYDVAGQAQNYGNQHAGSVSVGATLYNSSNVPVGCENVPIPGGNLDAGETSPFVISFSGYYRNYSDAAYYHLRVAGQTP